MADNFLSSEQVVSDEESYYNVLRTTGNAQTEFWDSLNEAEPFEGNPKTGHVFYQDAKPTTGQDNKHMEGGIRADVESYPEVELRNHLQILKRTYGITKSEKAATSRVAQKALDRSRDKSNTQLRLDVEYALLKDSAPVQRVAGTTEGEMGGLRHFITEVHDATGTEELSYKTHISNYLKLMYVNGVLEDKMILCGVDVKDAFNEILETQKRVSNNESKIHKNVTEIADAGWAKNVAVKSSVFLQPDEFIIYAPELINPVLLRQEKDNPVSDTKFDAEAWENLFEMTVQVLDPYAAVWVKNIKPSS